MSNKLIIHSFFKFHCCTKTETLYVSINKNQWKFGVCSIIRLKYWNNKIIFIFTFDMHLIIPDDVYWWWAIWRQEKKYIALHSFHNNIQLVLGTSTVTIIDDTKINNSNRSVKAVKSTRSRMIPTMSSTAIPEDHDYYECMYWLKTFNFHLIFIFS